MNREIKFRAWDGEQKCFRNDEFLISTTNGGKIQIVGVSIDMDTVRINEDIILMQFTGLLDKNGKEIYEGDVLKTLRFRNVVTNHVETILFLDGSFCTQTNDDVTVPISYHKEKEIEIIGNVFENPELLTPKP